METEKHPLVIVQCHICGWKGKEEHLTLIPHVSVEGTVNKEYCPECLTELE